MDICFGMLRFFDGYCMEVVETSSLCLITNPLFYTYSRYIQFIFYVNFVVVSDSYLQVNMEALDLSYESSDSESVEHETFSLYPRNEALEVRLGELFFHNGKGFNKRTLRMSTSTKLPYYKRNG